MCIAIVKMLWKQRTIGWEMTKKNQEIVNLNLSFESEDKKQVLLVLQMMSQWEDSVKGWP